MTLIATIPHSGEKIPPACTWLQHLPETLLMYDVDRYVDRLYSEALRDLGVPWVGTEWHRYAGDLNRVPEDVDQGAVVGAALPKGTHPRGFLWQITTDNHPLMKEPVAPTVFKELVSMVYDPFHAEVKKMGSAAAQKKGGEVLHLDLHSMPSRGTAQHRDPGELRADIVISDCGGKSASAEVVDAVMTSYLRAGFKVAHNWPYLGGRVSEQYGNPSARYHTVQVELNRGLYMDEQTKKWVPEKAEKLKTKLRKALEFLKANKSVAT